MQEQIINFQTAKLAKEKGFTPKNLSIGWKEDSYLWMCELQRWLREVHKIHISIPMSYTGFVIFITQETEYKLINVDIKPNTMFLKYEEALEYALMEALKLIK